jgi:hypothetical protein
MEVLKMWCMALDEDGFHCGTRLHGYRFARSLWTHGPQLHRPFRIHSEKNMHPTARDDRIQGGYIPIWGIQGPSGESLGSFALIGMMDQETANMRRLFSNWMSIVVFGLSLALLHCLQFPIRFLAAAVSIPLFVQFCSRERIIKNKHIICTPFELPIVSSESSAY